jgi:hypothetical protein
MRVIGPLMSVNEDIPLIFKKLSLQENKELLFSHLRVKRKKKKKEFR